ncbi:MAG: hypothetical protein AAGB28_18765 [Pseudomonadota bacterium]
MKRNILAIATVAALASGTAVQAMETEYNMLTGALYNALDQIDADTTKLGDLSLNQIAQIKAVLDGTDNDAKKKQRIETIMSK